MATTRYSIVPTLFSIAPVLPNQSYIGSVQVAVDINGRTCYAKFYWYDANYKFISTSALGTSAFSIGAFAWQELETQATSPSNAAFAGIVPEIHDPTGGNICEFYVDQHKITGSTMSTAGARAWQPPRQINITLTPNIINEMQNPSFGSPANPLWGWRPSGPDTSNTANSSIAYTGGTSLDVVTGGFLPGDLVNQLCCGAHTLSSVALYPGSDTAQPPITTLEPDTDYTISAYVKPLQGYLPIRISFFDGVGEYVGSSSPVTNVWQYPNAPWTRLSVSMHTGLSNVGSGRISIGYFASDMNAMTAPVEPDTPGQTAWTLWTNPPAQYKGIWQATSSYQVGDVVAIASTSGPPTSSAYFATALVANTSVNPVTDTGQTTWQRFNLFQTSTPGVTTTIPTPTPFYLDSYWTNLTRYRGDKIGLGVEYPAGSGTTYCMVQPSTIFGGFQELPMETHEFLIDAVMVQKGKVATDYFDGDVPAADYLWEGARWSSRSFFYQNRRSGQERLERIIHNYVPFGTPIQITYSQGAVSTLWSAS